MKYKCLYWFENIFVIYEIFYVDICNILLVYYMLEKILSIFKGIYFDFNVFCFFKLNNLKLYIRCSL